MEMTLELVPRKGQSRPLGELSKIVQKGGKGDAAAGGQAVHSDRSLFWF